MSNSGNRSNYSEGRIKNSAFTVNFTEHKAKLQFKTMSTKTPVIVLHRSKSNYFEIQASDISIAQFTSGTMNIFTFDGTDVITKEYPDLSLLNDNTFTCNLTDQEVSDLPLGRFEGRITLEDLTPNKVVSSKFALEVF